LLNEPFAIAFRFHPTCDLNLAKFEGNVSYCQAGIHFIIIERIKKKTMQLYALDNDLPVPATKAEKGKNYLCPECSATVRKREGATRQTHFYHLRLPKQCRQHQKSLEHLQLQLKLAHLIGQGAQLECPFPAIQRIGDVAWHEKKIVFEVQCSPILLEEVKNRHLDYEKAGYTVIWILHDKRFNQKALTASEAYARTYPCYFTNIDKTGEGIVYDQFDVIKGGRRLFKGPPLTISPTKITPPPSISTSDLALPQTLLDRLSKWNYYAQGDLLHRILKEGNLSQSAKKMYALESRLKCPPERTKEPKLPLHKLLRKGYSALLNWILKNI
jgi:competence protein CoiA